MGSDDLDLDVGDDENNDTATTKNGDHTKNNNKKTVYRAINQNTLDSQMASGTTSTAHTKIHHDTATLDIIGMTQALFNDKRASRWVMLIYYLIYFWYWAITFSS
jgi:hypothetical protein